MSSILDRINSPADVKKLNIRELKQLCEEIRSYMIECCAVNPGHLGSSLGAVELIVGMHYVFNAPEDKLVFDVSHQAYAHKILTGRRDAFRKNRKSDGISGFTRRAESPYDAFGAGHSSTSISAALGFAKSAELQGLPDKAVALIGDGSLSGGLAFEGLNNAGDGKTDILVIVNDNNMSIDDNIGAIHKHLLHLTTAPFYNTMKSRVWDMLGDTGFRKKLQKLTIRLKSSLVQKTSGDMFESMGFRYFGPIDGNDIESVAKALLRLRDLHGPRVLHAITKKGKGYAPAEKDQTIWHAPGNFDPDTGKRLKKNSEVSRYQDVFGATLMDLAALDDRIVGVTPAMASGCGMSAFAEKFPERFFDVGIAEEHAVTFSAGLAAGGLKPFCNIYSSFAQRAYDQVIHDVALQKLPVVLCLDRAGLVGEDGATHHGMFDLAAFRSVPNCTIAVPRNEKQLRNLMYSASLSKEGPYIIRYPRGYGEGMRWADCRFEEIPVGSAEKLQEGSKVAVLALGPCANRALEASARFRTLHPEIKDSPELWDVRFLKPFDGRLRDALSSGRFSQVLTIEDGAVHGGLFSEVAEILAESGTGSSLHHIGMEDAFVQQGTQEELREQCGLSVDKIVDKLEKVFGIKNL